MDALAVLTTALADRYELEREIGRGGMATVFLARDRRHGRRVAVKVLDPELGAILGGERFLSEIRVTANLQHPNLLPLFDSGEAGGLLYYVMPFIEGESLRARLDRERQLPVDEAVRLTIDIASALDYAHRQGVIHRDLKPENILLHEGQPLVADFGIALAVSLAGGARVTQTGLSLGTPQYMSPEQATGDRTIDGRTDIYSLGAVLYEMLAGEPPHMGGTAQAVIARLVTERPRQLSEVRTSVPAHVDRAVMHALEKLPADRFERARDFADALEGKGAALVSPVATTGVAPRQWSRGSRALAALACVALGFAGAWFGRGRAEPDEDVIRFPFTPPVGQRFTNAVPGFGVSPSGGLIAYRALAPDGTAMLYLRRLDDPTPRLVEGPVEPRAPVFSPDEQWIAYNSGGIMKIPVSGGTPFRVADINSRGMQWTDAGDILFGSVQGLRTVAATGGAPRVLTSIDSTRGERSHQHPVLLPGGKLIAFTIADSARAHRVAVVPLAGGTPTISDVLASQVLGMIDDHLVHVTLEGRVLAVPFSASDARSTGPAVPLLSGIAIDGSGLGDISLSRSGTLVHDANRGVFDLSVVDERGVPRRLIDSLRSYRNPRYSPDGKRVAVSVIERGISSLGIIDVESQSFERITSGNENAGDVEWSPDGTRLLCRLIRSGRVGLALVSLEGARMPVMTILGASEGSFTPDGKAIVYSRGARGALAVRALGDTVDREIDQNASAGRVSPDGRWVAYHVYESGTFQVYVRPFTTSGVRLQVSIGGGQTPVWSRDGRRLVYTAAGRTLISASLATTNGITVTRRDTVFSGQHEYTSAHANFDLAPDGRLLISLGNPAGSWMVVRHWDREVRRKLTAAKKPA